jgi:NADPH:quinone reductase-like Zn-dependent oxidoreductase
VVRIAEVDRPTIGDHGVLVKVHVTTVNRTDCHQRSAKPFIMRFVSGLIRPKLTVLGAEFAGVVEAIGEGSAHRSVVQGVEAPVPHPLKHDQRSVENLKGMIESGEFKPVLDRQYGLDQIIEAYRYVETKQKTAM